MIFDISTMKIRAKSLLKALSPGYQIAGVIAAFGAVLTFIFTFFDWPTSVIAIIGGIFAEFMSIGLDWYCLSVSREETPKVGAIFDVFTNQLFTVILSIIFRIIIFAVGLFLLVIPFFIAFYWFRPLNFIIKDNAGISVFKAMNLSIKLMKGHKLELFKVDISLIGWHILNFITLYICGVYVLPYSKTVYAEFYDHIKGQSNIITQE